MTAYTSNLFLAQPGVLDPSTFDAWGPPLNTDFAMIDSAVAGLLVLSVAGSSNVTLSSTQGAPDQARNRRFQFTGVLAGNVTVLFPPGARRAFTVLNSTTGAYTLSVGVSNGAGAPAGGTLAVPQGSVYPCFSDGVNVSIDTVLPNVTGALGPLTNVASAATVDLGALPSNYSLITGTTTISSFGTTATIAAPFYMAQFAGSLTLTYNATSLILPGAQSIVTQAGDAMILTPLGSGNWQVLAYFRASGLPIGLPPLAPPVRQCVVGGAVDANGNPNFLSNGVGLSMNLLATSTPIEVAMAYGFGAGGAVDYIVQITADVTPAWSGLTPPQTISTLTISGSTATLTTSSPHGLGTGGNCLISVTGATPSTYNGTYVASVTGTSTLTYKPATVPGGSGSGASYAVASFLYIDRNITTGAITYGATTQVPAYYPGGAASTVNAAHTYLTSQGVMFVGNGSTASQVQRVFVGYAFCGGTNITSYAGYQIQGLYIGSTTPTSQGGWTAPLPNSLTGILVNHNLGTDIAEARLELQNITPEVGYNAGNIAQPYTTATSGYPLPVGVAHDTFRVWFGTGNSGLQAVNRATGDGPTTLTAANWQYRLVVKRSF